MYPRRHALRSYKASVSLGLNPSEESVLSRWASSLASVSTFGILILYGYRLIPPRSPCAWLSPFLGELPGGPTFSLSPIGMVVLIFIRLIYLSEFKPTCRYFKIFYFIFHYVNPALVHT
jgi:hypothetical protein